MSLSETEFHKIYKVSLRYETTFDTEVASLVSVYLFHKLAVNS